VREIELEPAATQSVRPQARRPSLDAVYREHAELVSRWILRLDPRADAEDLLHDVFLVVRRRLPGFRGDSALTTWLYAITLRVVIGQRRKRRVRLLLFGHFERGEVDRPSRTPESDATRAEASRVLYALLDELSERDRALLIAFELEGLSGRELAEVAGVAEGNVWTLLRRARMRLRRAYVRRFGELEGGRA
jgi:RNA polymerase sigma-70 factor (ECF subfamily)